MGKTITVDRDGAAVVDGKLFLDVDDAKAYVKKKVDQEMTTSIFSSTMASPIKTSYGKECYGILEMSRKELFGSMEVPRSDLFAGDAFIDAGAFQPTGGRPSTSRQGMFDDAYGDLDSPSLEDELSYGALESESLEEELEYGAMYGALSDLSLADEFRYLYGDYKDKRLDSSARLGRKKYLSV